MWRASNVARKQRDSVIVRFEGSSSGGKKSELVSSLYMESDVSQAMYHLLRGGGDPEQIKRSFWDGQSAGRRRWTSPLISDSRTSSHPLVLVAVHPGAGTVAVFHVFLPFSVVPPPCFVLWLGARVVEPHVRLWARRLVGAGWGVSSSMATLYDRAISRTLTPLLGRGDKTRCVLIE